MPLMLIEFQSVPNHYGEITNPISHCFISDLSIHQKLSRLFYELRALLFGRLQRLRRRRFLTASPAKAAGHAGSTFSDRRMMSFYLGSMLNLSGPPTHARRLYAKGPETMRMCAR